MSAKNMRIAYRNVYEDSLLLYQNDGAIYKTDTVRNVIMDATRATSPSKSDLLYTKPTTHYTLVGAYKQEEDISCIAFVRPNIPGTSEFRFTVWTEDDWGGSYAAGDWSYKITMDDIGIIPGWGDFIWGAPWAGNAVAFDEYNPMSSVLIVWVDNPKIKVFTKGGVQWMDPDKFRDVKYWKLEFILEGANPLELSIDRMFMGAHTELTYNLSHGHNMTFVDSSKSYRTEGGSKVSVSRERFKQISFSLSVISAENRMEISRLLAIIGTHHDALVSLYPINGDNLLDIRLETDYSLLGKFTKAPIMSEIIGGYYKTTMKLEET